jgi:hypothetical protein
MPSSPRSSGLIIFLELRFWRIICIGVFFGLFISQRIFFDELELDIEAIVNIILSRSSFWSFLMDFEGFYNC